MEYTNQGKKMSPAKRRKNRIQKAFKTVGEMLVGIQILATLVFLLFTWRLGMIREISCCRRRNPSDVRTDSADHTGGFQGKSHYQQGGQPLYDRRAFVWFYVSLQDPQCSI